MQPALEEFYEPFYQLQKIFAFNDQNNIALTNLFTKIKSAYENVALLFRSLGENFHKEISKDSLNERSYVYFQYLGNYLLKVSEINKEFSKKIYSNVLIPYSEVSHQVEVKTKENLNKIEKIFYNIDISKAALKRHQDSYYKLSKSADKAQDNFEKLVTGNKSEEQIMKAQDKLLKVKMEAQEAGNLYRQQLKTTNQHWDALYATYEPVFSQYDELEAKKTAQTRDIVKQLILNFNSFYQPSESQLLEDPEIKLQEFDDKLVAKPDSLRVMSSPTLDEILKNKPLEEFSSYEAKKKIDELTIIKSVENEEYTVIYSASNESDVQFIMDFSKIFQSALYNEINLEASFDQNDSPLMSEIAARERLVNDSQPTIKFPLVEEDEKKIWEIIKNPVNRKFLLDNLAKSKEALRGNKPVILQPNVYFYLQKLMKKILDDVLEDRDFDGLCSFLNVVSKYSTVDQDITLTLDEYFRNEKVWRSTEIWKDITKTFYDKKVNEDNVKQKKAQETEKATKAGPFMDKIFNLSVKQFLDKTSKSRTTSLSDREIYFSILHDVAYYLGRLTESISVATEIIIEVTTDLGFEPEIIEGLVFIINKERNNIFKDKISEYSSLKKIKAQKKWKNLYPLYLSLDFLDIKDLLNLSQLNKEVREKFKRRVYRTIFHNFSNDLTLKQRFSIWYNILELKNFYIDFRKYTPEFINTTDATLKQAEEVINIDVIRSFKKHGDFDQKVLKDLLKGYAALDKESSYCQGMNYIMGFFFLHTQDPDLSFRYFVKLMQDHMTPMFDKDFKQLRVYFFKLNKILELFVPDLAEHFKKEKIDASFYAPSWFITAFTSTYQYSPHSKLLEKIWDFFILDGVKALFKTTLLILKEYKNEIRSLRFDLALNFMSELGKQELFTNVKYKEILEGKCSIEEAPKEFKFINEFQDYMKETHLTQPIINAFDDDFNVFEHKLPELTKPSNK